MNRPHPSPLTVNSRTTYCKGEYFRKELTVGNSSAAQWTNISVTATGETTVSGNVFVAKTPEAFYYDLDGNLTNDGRWTYTWDLAHEIATSSSRQRFRVHVVFGGLFAGALPISRAEENRLVNLTSASSAPTGSKLKLDFTYDWKGRRVEKLVSTNNGSSYGAQYTNRFVYDGWNLMAVLSPDSSVIRSFLWGLDLSGSLQGAGGVGGLLAVNDTANGAHFYAYDGNGNVAALVHPVRYGNKILLRVCAAKRQRQRVLYRLYPRPARAFSKSSGRRCAIHTGASSAHLGLLRSLSRPRRRDTSGKVFEVSLGEAISQEQNEELSHGVKATDGTISANCEYGPFGEVLRLTGLMAKANPFRFSTKYQDDETDMLYYGYRSYNPVTGRWLSRDPIDEVAGPNLYEFVFNNSAGLIDNLGNAPMGWPVVPPPGYPSTFPPKQTEQRPAEGIKWGKLCSPNSRRLIATALNTICSKIASPEFARCMGAGLGGEYTAALKDACSYRGFKIECDDVCRVNFFDGKGPTPVQACARASKTEQTIFIYADFFGDVCGTKPCMIGHELLHMVASLPHPKSNRTFDQLHTCLGCERGGY